MVKRKIKTSIVMSIVAVSVAGCVLVANASGKDADQINNTNIKLSKSKPIEIGPAVKVENGIGYYDLSGYRKIKNIDNEANEDTKIDFLDNKYFSFLKPSIDSKIKDSEGKLDFRKIMKGEKIEELNSDEYTYSIDGYEEGDSNTANTITLTDESITIQSVGSSSDSSEDIVKQFMIMQPQIEKLVNGVFKNEFQPEVMEFIENFMFSVAENGKKTDYYLYLDDNTKLYMSYDKDYSKELKLSFEI